MAARAKTTTKDTTPKAPPAESELKAKIAKAVGVAVTDVIGFSAEKRVIVTRQGGKYQLTADGQVLRLMGPVPPSQIKE